MDSRLATLFLIGTLGLSSCSHGSKAVSTKLREGSKEIQFKASDGATAFADLYAAKENPQKRIVLMFHQAGSNSTEYSPIAPRVASWGYDCLAVDQRSGGDMFDAINRTVEGGSKGDYNAAYQDLEGALSWATVQGYKDVTVWGSSYSASLALRLAAEHPEIKRVLTFSPGEYFDQKGIVAGWAVRVKQPTLMAFAPKELADGQRLFGYLPSSPLDVLVTFDKGVHGSSTLRRDKNPNSSEQYWTAVERFFRGK